MKRTLSMILILIFVLLPFSGCDRGSSELPELEKTGQAIDRETTEQEKEVVPSVMSLPMDNVGKFFGCGGYVPWTNSEKGAYFKAFLSENRSDSETYFLFLDFETRQLREIKDHDFTDDDFNGVLCFAGNHLYVISERIRQNNTEEKDGYIARFDESGKNREEIRFPDGFRSFNGANNCAVAFDGKDPYFLLFDQSESNANGTYSLCKSDFSRSEIIVLETIEAVETVYNIIDVYHDGIIIMKDTIPAGGERKHHSDYLADEREYFYYIYAVTGEKAGSGLIEAEGILLPYSDTDPRYYLDKKKEILYYPTPFNGLAKADLTKENGHLFGKSKEFIEPDLFLNNIQPENITQRIYGATEEYYLIWMGDCYNTGSKHVATWSDPIFPRYVLIKKEDYVESNPVFIEFGDCFFETDQQ